MTTLLDHCTSGGIEQAEAVRIDKASKPLAALTDDNGDLSAFIPKSD
jgi:hypothetical protein